MSIVLQGSTSGSVTLQEPAVAGTTVIDLPATSGTMVVTGGAQTVQFAAGSAAAPAITTSGDTNTGIFFPAADTIAFTEGGVESMRIDSSGNVGIGTSTPRSRLNLATSTAAGSVALTPSIVLSNRNNTNSTFMAGGIFADFYRDVADPSYNAGIWFERIPASGNLSSDANIIFGSMANASSSVPTERMRIAAGGDLQFNSGYGSVATAYGCRAWVNFNGTGTVAIRASGNVSSITDHGTGQYSVNFTTSMPNANYSVVGMCNNNQGINYGGRVTIADGNVYTTSVMLFVSPDAGASLFDSSTVCVSVFR
jgi:hypothetical protein